MKPKWYSRAWKLPWKLFLAKWNCWCDIERERRRKWSCWCDRERERQTNREWERAKGRV